MEITFLGTGTSMGVPVAGGFGGGELFHDPRNTRTRCSVWVKTNKHSILIDAGPEFRIQSIRNRIQNIDHILITHEHMDHIAGLEDLRAYNYVQKEDIPVYGTESCMRSIRSRFDYMFGEGKYPGSTSLKLIPVHAPFDIGDQQITPLPVDHGDLSILGFRINDFCYLTDVKDIPESTKKLIRKCRLLVLSGLRWEIDHPAHLTIPQAVDLIEELEAEQGLLIHMNSLVDHQKSNERLPGHIKLAFDQQVVRLPD